ncbi:arginyl-tRNA synthetase [Fomitopsis serialis]|uniref:arginyl-tRNA synthetase n=1 Tax=Fomitopsis serialis TaxID=139415 RepID=UPI002007E69F|nr:arginyl-tRNA synthetase [Neoantrodia serialis]KAH9933048.1 arginyl-tRNA synthetase [Neoantrodia serialis]
MSTGFKIPAHLRALPQLPGVEFERCVMDAFRTAIAQLIAEALPELTTEQVLEAVDYGKKDEDFTVHLGRFRLPGKLDVHNQKVLSKMGLPPFHPLHHTMNRLVLDQVYTLTHATPSGQAEYGSNTSGQGKRVIIEYSSPNIAKQFHVGHLRSTIIGGFLANLYKACGWEVISMNYLGDWGTQFGLIAVGFNKYGSREELEKDAIKHLFEVYVKINADAAKDPSVKVDAAAFFKRMEDGDETALADWRMWRELSVKKYEEDYARLNVHFDVYTGESQVGKESQNEALARLEQMGLIEDTDGAKLVNLEEYKLARAVVRKKDGTSIYLTRDIGGAMERYEKYKFDKMLYVISTQQDLHLMELPWADRIEHINYGLVLGMSTRKGTVVFLDDIIREAGSVTHEHMRKNEDKYQNIKEPEVVSQEVGISGIKVQDMTAKRINSYTFNWDRVLSAEGDTGPYLQYAHVRISSITRNNPELLPLPPTSEIKTELLTEPPKHESSEVTTFAFRLSHAISQAWMPIKVKGEPDLEKARARMWMYLRAKDVLASAMRLLTLRPVDYM